MLNFTYNGRQFRALEGLAFWAQEAAWTEERYGAQAADLPRLRENMRDSFRSCDAAGVPMWVQNTVSAFGHDWRRYMSTYLDLYLNSKGITRQAADAGQIAPAAE